MKSKIWFSFFLCVHIFFRYEFHFSSLIRFPNERWVQQTLAKFIFFCYSVTLSYIFCGLISEQWEKNEVGSFVFHFSLFLRLLLGFRATPSKCMCVCVCLCTANLKYLKKLIVLKWKLAGKIHGNSDCTWMFQEERAHSPCPFFWLYPVLFIHIPFKNNYF